MGSTSIRALGAIVLATLIAGGAWVILRNPKPTGPAGSGTSSAAPASPIAAASTAGSQSCRECHERFYELWSTSHHGLAMQPFTPDLAKKHFTAPPAPIKAGNGVHQAEFTDAGGWVVERIAGTPDKRYPIVHLMGGKNVFYLLTTLDRGRLQVLPVAYDVRRNEWYDTAASAMRHFQGATDTPLDWRDPLYTFNTSCHGCHVSQLATNYDIGADSYHTIWSEPGINCETCHGPSSEHVRVFKEAPPGTKPAELKLISTRPFTPDQHNASCSSCHAKASIVTNAFMPGDRFFDHFDLAALENPDFYPDGRDLGENYTYTGWRMNPCANSGQLHCVQCHTSSGRYRFKGEKANDACMPCHEERVKNAAAHTRHKPDSAGNVCIACHMPTTEFARMTRSDHSMLPPAPAATIAFKSPNACNVCHADKDAAWADQQVRSWHKDDYQAPVLHRGALVAAARKGDYARLDEMLAYIADAKRDEMTSTSLIRLLAGCADGRKHPALINALKDPSPLVRSAAALGLAGLPVPEALPALVNATGDEYRIVRIRAAAMLVGQPMIHATAADRARFDRAMAELESSYRARPDDWTSHYNMGNHYTELGRLDEALRSFALATRLRPDAVAPLVNQAIVQARLGRSSEAAVALRKALAAEPANPAANFNMGLLYAEEGNLAQAEQHLRAALKADPAMAEAAYNLGMLVVQKNPGEGVDLIRKAFAARPQDPRYGYTLAFYQAQSRDTASAVATLRAVLQRHPAHLDSCMLLASILERQGKLAEARDVYLAALKDPGVDPRTRQAIEQRIRLIESGSLPR